MAAYFAAPTAYPWTWPGDATRTIWQQSQASEPGQWPSSDDGSWCGGASVGMRTWPAEPVKQAWKPVPGTSNTDMWVHKADANAWQAGGKYTDYEDNCSASYSEFSDYSSASSTCGSWTFLPEEPSKIYLVNSLTSGACESLCREAETADVVGLDAEWVPDWTSGSNNPVSVLQLAFPQSCRVYVIQLGTMSGQLPQAVQLMLLNPEVTKVGFGCSYKDAAKFELSGIVVTKGSTVDVQSRCAVYFGTSEQIARSLSLKRAALELLGFILEKDKKHTCSDWSVEKLSPEQVRYAAMDAWVALRLYYRTL